MLPLDVLCYKNGKLSQQTQLTHSPKLDAFFSNKVYIKTMMKGSLGARDVNMNQRYKNLVKNILVELHCQNMPPKVLSLLHVIAWMTLSSFSN